MQIRTEGDSRFEDTGIRYKSGGNRLSRVFTLPISTLRTKVVSVIRCWKNGAFTSVDNLELSIIWNAPFLPGFLEVI
jgi:hypothetical protein